MSVRRFTTAIPGTQDTETAPDGHNQGPLNKGNNVCRLTTAIPGTVASYEFPPSDPSNTAQESLQAHQEPKSHVQYESVFV